VLTVVSCHQHINIVDARPKGYAHNLLNIFFILWKSSIGFCENIKEQCYNFKKSLMDYSMKIYKKKLY